MSFRSRQVKLTSIANRDFVDLLRKSRQVWGQAQLMAFRTKIDDAMSSIGRNPEIGHRSELYLTIYGCSALHLTSSSTG
ncbi:MAG: hypothetical protein JWQ11_961 [Rhizobacter sp.]|nr:hypothetical protein [Rhizobacter sp.]